MTPSLKETIVDVVARQLRLSPQKVSPTSSLREDLGADSLTIIEIAMALERVFKIEIPDVDTRFFKTVTQIVKYIQSKISDESTLESSN